MNEISNIKYNSFFSFISIASRLIPNVIIFWILARYFGPISFGKFSYSHTIANTFLLFADFGFDLLITTEVARKRNEAEKIFQEYFWIKIGLAIVSLIAMWIFVFANNGDDESIWLGIIFSFYMLFNTITNFYVASFKGFEKLEYDAKVSISMNIFLFVTTCLLFLFYPNIVLIAITYVLSRIIGLSYSLKITKKIIPELSYRIVFRNIKLNMKKAFLYGLLILASSFLFQLDTIMLGIYKLDYEVGIYQAVKNLMLVPFIIPGIVFSALLPTLARNYKENIDNWNLLNSVFFKMVFWLNIPIAILFYVYPTQIIELLYGKENYSLAIPILKIFSVILFLRSTSDYVGVMLITSNRQNVHIYTSVLCIIISIIVGSILIPNYGAMGAGIVYLIIISIVSLVYLIVNRNIFIKYILNYNYVLLVIISLITILTLQRWFTNDLILGTLITVLISILTVFVIFKRNERTTIFSVDLFRNIKKV